MFRNTSIKTRLVFVLALLCIELVAGAFVGLYNLGRANDDMGSMYELVGEKVFPRFRDNSPTAAPQEPVTARA